MLKALGNVAPRHLLDTRLNPPPELREAVGRVLPLTPVRARIAAGIQRSPRSSPASHEQARAKAAPSS